MTRRIEIVNTSNWDGEDYLITRGDDPSIMLAPGDSVDLAIYREGVAEKVAITPVGREGGTAPFMLSGAGGNSRQVQPNRDGSFE